MLGSIEYSTEYIRLYNLLSRCRGCRKGRCRNGGVEKPEWRRKQKTVVPDKKVRAPKRVRRESLPCVLTCNRIHAADIDYYDVLRFEELKDEFEPLEIDFSEDNERMNACVEVDENGCWVRIELTSLV